MRLIDADELLKQFSACNFKGYTMQRLIENAPTIDAVELPCKIGDTVWVARRYKCHKRPRWGIVSEMFFTNDMELCIVVKSVARGKWGVDVFATYEETEAQIEKITERTNKHEY